MKSIEDAFKETKIEAVQKEESKNSLIRQQSAPAESHVTVKSAKTTDLSLNNINKVNTEDAANLNTFVQRSANFQPSQQITTQQQAQQAKRILTERVGDWVCLNCNNLNFSFRDFCNRCDMDRKNIGKTITSA